MDVAYGDPMTTIIHLVRHGEVHNPKHIVYTDLPGYKLSELGRQQAFTTAIQLAARPITEVWSSPLIRAIETAEPLAAGLLTAVRIDPELTEWHGLDGWKGHAWEEVPSLFPGQLEAYLENPADLPFAPESLRAVADRIISVMDAIAQRDGEEAVIVSHQDPIHAAIRVATGRGFPGFFTDKPTHASAHTLQKTEEGWDLTGVYESPL